MNSFVLNPRTKAFTLVEMLVVIAIIGILAALLLPALNGGQRRAQRIFCENSLQEIGVAFHVFSNDHTGKFPMDVSTNDGGSMEYIENGFRAGQIFYTAYHTFQVLSNELVRSQLLVCPADLREAVSNFPALQNKNVSYFVGANGTFDKPASILAGDRNLTTNSFETPTILEIGPQSRLSWTWEMHQFQGNVVFGDGHVEEWNQSGLKSGEGQISPDEGLFLPTVVAVANSGPGGSGSSSDNGGGSGNGGGGSSGYGGNTGGGNLVNGANSGPTIQSATYQPPSSPMPTHPMTSMSPGLPAQTTPVSDRMHQSVSETASAASRTETPSDATQTTTTTESNDTVAVATPIDADATMSPFDRNLTKTLRHTFGWLYLLLLLLALLYIIYRLLKWMKERDEKMKAKGPR
jgi:prepilin-type N-terminal cleavage/methylation domain-containing protein/prepilin-type processing-associated H-X9-DG protein